MPHVCSAYLGQFAMHTMFEATEIFKVFIAMFVNSDSHSLGTRHLSTFYYIVILWNMYLFAN